jgi:hypothetical protein
MEDLKDTLNENATFYREQERKITARLALLPKGRIRSKTIGGAAYSYLQYRKGRSVKTDYIGRVVPTDLLDLLAERDRLEKELLAVREALRLLRSRRKEEVDLTEPVLAILRAMTPHQRWESGFEIIGSWCFLLYQKHLPMERYPLKTEDLDILVPRPFKGRAFDLPGMMQRLSFSQHFNADGSMCFTGNGMRVEFVTKERRDGRRPPRVSARATGRIVGRFRAGALRSIRLPHRHKRRRDHPLILTGIGPAGPPRGGAVALKIMFQ